VTDAFTLGETMVRLTPKGHTRLEEAAQLELRTGGSESNVAVALVRLGMRAMWASRLPDNPLGRLTARRLTGFRVDLSAVRWVDDGRMGLYFIEAGAAPRPSTVLYDRAGSAAAGMTPEDFNWSLLDGCRHVHLTGITFALGPGPAATAARAAREAKARGLSLSLDVNYRARLWSAAAARAALEPVLPAVDLLICPAADAREVFDLPEDPESAARDLAALAGGAQTALTLGGEGALLWDGAAFHRAAAFPVQAVDRVGAGDAFDAGLLWGFLRGDAPRGLALGMAMAALKHTMPGDEWVGSLEEAEALLRSGHQDIRR